MVRDGPFDLGVEGEGRGRSEDDTTTGAPKCTD